MLSKKHQKSSTVQEEGLTNEGRDHLHNQAHDKRGIVESLHVRWAYFQEKYYNSHKYTYSHFEESLRFIVYACIFKREYGIGTELHICHNS